VRAFLVAFAIGLCPTPVLPQDLGGGAARVLVMTGRVSILRDNSEWALNTGSVVQPKQVVITGSDGYAKFELSDGSIFEVFQDSRVVFRPTSWSDLLDLWIGRVKVYIQHRNGPNYNKVTTQTAVISVRGTVFDVVAEDEDTTFVSVDEGVVEVQHARLPGRDVFLHAGESVRVFKDQPLARAIDKGSVGRAALRAVEQAIYEGLARRGAGGTAAGTTTGGGPQGDQKRGGNGSGSTNSGSSGGAPPPPPPPPPSPPN
jgi:ferric-dicitrate binding protein FerR (iron transport regulator)